jgi:hypothetical protein
MERAACERRVYRLATLLTGSPRAAVAIVEAVVDAQPDLGALDSAHLDRLTVLRSRERDAAAIALEGAPRRLADALAELPFQAREAWIFRRLYRVDQREAARAMDCSVTAADRHLERADIELNETLGPEPDASIEAFRRYTLTLDLPHPVRRRRRLRERQRRAIWLLALAAFVLGAIAGLLWVASRIG